MTYNVAVIGASGEVGRTILDILHERSFPIKKLVALASDSAGCQLSYGKDRSVIVENLCDYDFVDIDLAFFAASAEVASKFIPKITKKGTIVIDNSSFFRMDDQVPLIVPEVNPEALKHYKQKNIISNPNCSTIQMVVALKPLHDHFSIQRVTVSTYQATSGAGKKAKDELLQQTQDESMDSAIFTKQIAYNVIPHIDVFLEEGITKEEWKMQRETQKILDANIKVHANCARIASLNGHAEYINIETEKPIDVKKAREILAQSPGIKVVDQPCDAGYSTPCDASGKDEVFISRIRQDVTVQNGLSFWCVADNTRKGAALNAVQIAELL